MTAPIPQRGAEVVGKFATQHKIDVVFGTLFSHVVIGSAPAAGELKMPYFVVSEGHHVASTKLNRYVFQPGITDVKSQVIAMAPWIAGQCRQEGHADLPRLRLRLRPSRLSAAGAEGAGRRGDRADRHPADGELVHPLLPADPGRDRGDLPRHGRPGRAHLRQGARRVLRLQPAAAVRLHRFAGGRRHQQPRPRIPRRQPFLGRLAALPRRTMPAKARKFYRDEVGIDANGAAVSDPKDISTASHMFGCWETLYVIKQAMEAAGYKGPEDRRQAGRGDRGADRLRRRARSIRRATRPSTARCTRPTATRTSPRSRAAS